MEDSCPMWYICLIHLVQVGEDQSGPRSTHESICFWNVISFLYLKNLAPELNYNTSKTVKSLCGTFPNFYHWVCWHSRFFPKWSPAGFLNLPYPILLKSLYFPIKQSWPRKVPYLKSFQNIINFLIMN